MGVGMDGHPNYTEDDVKECGPGLHGLDGRQRHPALSLWQSIRRRFVYNPDDHDDGEKTFLGETGNWNGEDIINIIVKQPATARFVSRHLYNFFVADERRCRPGRTRRRGILRPSRCWRTSTSGPITTSAPCCGVLFNSDFFKNARFAKVKSPVGTVVGTMRLVGDFTFPKPGLQWRSSLKCATWGRTWLNPPTVEGWHTGKEWIDSGTLVERINFTADQMGNVNLPGVRAIIDRLRAEGPTLSPERLVDGCLELLGAL